MAKGKDTSKHPARNVGRDSFMNHIMDFEMGNVTDDNVHDVASAIRDSRLDRSAGRYGRFLNWYDTEYGRD